MSLKHFIIPSERKRLREEAVRRAVTNIQGPVGFYETWPGEGSNLYITEDAKRAWRHFCNLVAADPVRRQKCKEDYENRVSNACCPQVSTCWLGVHNAICPVTDGNDENITLIGGAFRVKEHEEDAKQYLDRFLATIPEEHKKEFSELWGHLPVYDLQQVGYLVQRELEIVGKSYLSFLRQLMVFRYDVEQVNHDLVILLQSLIGNIENLQVDLRKAFGIGKKWESRFDEIIQSIEMFHRYQEARLGVFTEPEFNYFPISQIVYECVDLHKPKARKRGIEIKVDLQKIIDANGQQRTPEIKMAYDYMNRAFHNVIDNAIKYSYAGTVDQWRYVDVIGKLEDLDRVPGYSLEISNYGIGVEEDEWVSVFEPGVQGRRRQGEYRPGSGMGLAFVKECIETNHKGKVSLRSYPSKGTGWLTILKIWLPLFRS